MSYIREGRAMERQSIRVLLVDDDIGEAALTKRALSAIRTPRFEVECAETLGEAIDKTAAQKYDVVLLDQGLPDSSSQETLARFRETTHDVMPIIVLTGLNDEERAIDSVANGAQDYLTKDDISADVLARSIRYALSRQQLLREIKAANELLEDKNRRLAALYNTAQEFVENVSHEFRTPLTVIREFTSIIRDGLDGPVTAKQAEHLNKVLYRTDDLSLMVDDMLDISRLEAGLLAVWRRPCQANELLENVVGLLKGRAALKKVALSMNVAPDLPDVYCDEEKARRVLMNLTVNSIKFAPEHGVIEVWARPADNGSDIEIGVRDNGPGISKENLEVIFDRFRQVDQALHRSTKGFGLGLNIAKELVTLNLGRMNVESAPGRGSTFSFTLPQHRTDVVFDRFLRRALSLADAASEVCLYTVDAKLGKAEAAVVVDEFLQRALHATDLVMATGDSRWVVAAVCPEHDQERMIQRLTNEWAQFVRNSPQLKSAPLKTAYRGAWSVADEVPDLTSAFIELCEVLGSEPKPMPKVLVVDDDREVSHCLGLRLESAGFEVISASDGAEGLKVARSAKPDAIVMDVRMPKKDGLTALRELRTDSQIKATPVIILSASIRDQQNALQAGASFFVRKPYEASEVLSAIESSLGSLVS